MHFYDTSEIEELASKLSGCLDESGTVPFEPLENMQRIARHLDLSLQMLVCHICVDICSVKKEAIELICGENYPPEEGSVKREQIENMERVGRHLDLPSEMLVSHIYVDVFSLRKDATELFMCGENSPWKEDTRALEERVHTFIQSSSLTPEETLYQEVQKRLEGLTNAKNKLLSAENILYQAKAAENSEQQPLSQPSTSMRNN